MSRILWHWAISAIALLLAASVVRGVQMHHWYNAIWVAVLLGLVNAVVGGITSVISWFALPVNLLTLGCFGFVLSFVLYTGTIFGLFRANGGPLNDGMTVSSFFSAVGLAIVMGVFSSILNIILPGRDARKKR